MKDGTNAKPSPLPMATLDELIELVEEHRPRVVEVRVIVHPDDYPLDEAWWRSGPRDDQILCHAISRSDFASAVPDWTPPDHDRIVSYRTGFLQMAPSRKTLFELFG